MKNIVFLTLGLIIGLTIAIFIIPLTSPEENELEIIDREIEQGEEPAEWFSCNQDSDCIYLDNDVCQYQGYGLGWRAVNKNYEEQFQAVQSSEREGVMCTQMFIEPPEQDPICLNNQCTIPE